MLPHGAKDGKIQETRQTDRQIWLHT